MSNDSTEKLLHLANPSSDLAHFEVSRNFQSVITPAAIGVIGGGTIATAALALEWHAVIFALFAFAFVISIVLLLVHIRTLEHARTAVHITLEQWCANQDALRTNARERIQMEFKVAKGGTLNYQPSTTNQTLVIEDGISARQFAKYFREFLQAAAFKRSVGNGVTGMERDRWIGQHSIPYQFSDGATLTRPIYEMLLDTAKSAGLLEGRAKGTAGQSRVGVGARQPSQPSQANQAPNTYVKLIGDDE